MLEIRAAIKAVKAVKATKAVTVVAGEKSGAKAAATKCRKGA